MLKQIGRYRLVRELGSDVMSATHEAVTGKGADGSPVIVVVAKMPVRLAPEETELFRVEAAATTELSPAHLARVIDHGLQHGMPFVVHEHTEGWLVAAKLEEHGALAAELAAALALDVAEALCAAHRCQPPLLHRAISPGTVLLDASLRARVLGYALAGVCIQGVRRTPSMAKMAFRGAAPELVEGKPLGPAADLFGLGAFLVATLLGAAPSSGATALAPDALDATLATVSVPPSMRELLGQLLDPAPERRGSAESAAETLRALVRDPGAARQALADALGIEPSTQPGGPSRPSAVPDGAPEMGVALDTVTKETALPDALRVLAPERPAPVSAGSMSAHRGAAHAAPAHARREEPPTPRSPMHIEEPTPRDGVPHRPAPARAVEITRPEARRVDTAADDFFEGPTIIETAMKQEPASEKTALLDTGDHDALPPQEKTVQLQLPDAPRRSHHTPLSTPVVRAPEVAGTSALPQWVEEVGGPSFKRWLEAQSKVEVGGWPLPWLVGMGAGAVVLVLVAAAIGIWLAS